jgi:hypothetical protein
MSVTLQNVHDGRVRLNLARACMSLDNALQVHHWIRDLQYLVVPTALVCATIGLVLAAYCVATTDASVWPMVLFESIAVLLGALWLLAAFLLWERVLRWCLYITLGELVLAAAGLLVWLLQYDRVRTEVAWLWWTIAAVLGIQALAVTGAALALTNILDARLVIDTHVCLLASVVTHTEQQVARGGDTHESVGSGALALSSMAGATKVSVSSSKKVL